jgi:hypothetical protein
MRCTILILFIFSILCVNAKAQAPPSIEWQKCLGGYEYDAINSIQSLKSGGYIMAGKTQSADGDITSSKGASDAWVIEIDALGNIIWQKNYGGSFADNATDIQVTDDGGYILLGSASSNNGDVSGNHGPSFDVWLVKTDASGNIE